MMERTSNCCCTRASLVALFAFVIFPVRSGCSEYDYKSLIEAKPECCAKEDAELRTRDIDYDSFVGLMGRRSVAQPKRDIDDTFADMLGRLTGMACPCVEEYLQTKRGFNAFRNGMPRLLHLRAAVARSSLDQRTMYQSY